MHEFTNPPPIPDQTYLVLPIVHGLPDPLTKGSGVELLITHRIGAMVASIPIQTFRESADLILRQHLVNPAAH